MPGVIARQRQDEEARRHRERRSFRDKAAALKFIKKVPKRHGSAKDEQQASRAWP